MKLFFLIIMNLLKSVVLLLILTSSMTTARPNNKRRRGGDMHTQPATAVIKFAKDFQFAVQNGPVKTAIKFAKKAKRYKNKLYLDSYAFAATLRGQTKKLMMNMK